MFGMAAFLLSYAAMREEAFFWTAICLVGAAGFFLPRPSIPLRMRIKLIGVWDSLAPILLVVFVTIRNPGELRLNLLRLVFLIIFLVGFSTPSTLFFKRIPK